MRDLADVVAIHFLNDAERSGGDWQVVMEEIIRNITEAEAQADALIAEARETAKQLLAEAAAESERIAAETKAEVKRMRERMLTEAEETARREYGETLAQGAAASAARAETARRRVETEGAAIAAEVVHGDC